MLETAREAAAAIHAKEETQREVKIAELLSRCRTIATRVLELEAALEKTSADRSADMVRGWYHADIKPERQR